MTTLIYSLPFYDTNGVSAYHLGHITNPPRSLHSSVEYHDFHVLLLEDLLTYSPDPIMSFYRDRWDS